MDNFQRHMEMQHPLSARKGETAWISFSKEFGEFIYALPIGVNAIGGEEHLSKMLWRVKPERIIISAEPYRRWIWQKVLMGLRWTCEGDPPELIAFSQDEEDLRWLFENLTQTGWEDEEVRKIYFIRLSLDETVWNRFARMGVKSLP